MDSHPLASPFGLLLRALEETLSREFAWPSPDAGFALFTFHQAGEEGPLPGPSTLAWPAEDRLVHAPSLSACGYWLACGQGSSLADLWVEGLDRLSRREAFPADRQSFVYRPVELLGIAAGAGAVAQSKLDLAKWLREVLARLQKHSPADLWSGCLRTAADLLLSTRRAVPAVQLEEARVEEVAVARWIARSLAGATETTDIDATLLQRSMLEIADSLDLARSAVLYQSLRAAVTEIIESAVGRDWQVGRTQRDAAALVVTLCQRFHLFAQQLLDRHDNRETVKIVDEHDVQDLLHALLKFHFDDVRAEEVTPSVAGKSGRMDFLLKRERLVVETKMTRKSLQQREVGDELIIDMKRYRSHPDYRTLICLVYDPAGFCHAPAALENDLTGLDGDFQTHVVVCPKGM